MTDNDVADLAASVLRLRGRPWLVLVSYLVVLAVLISLMQNVRWLDLSGMAGRHLGTAMVAAWCSGLGVLLLGVVRRHNSRFTLRTLSVLTAAIAVYLGSCQALHPVIPTLIVAAALSITMLYAAQRIGTELQPFRGRLSRVIMAVGGLIFLAHCVRVLGFFVLVRLGLVGAPSQLE
jgi:ABC-type enterochelin transport system permease subunit